MKIQAVFCDYKPTSGSQQVLKKINFSNADLIFNKGNDKFTPSFCGYGELVSKIVKTNFKTDSELEKIFRTMFAELKSDAAIKKNSDFWTISNLYETSGIRGLLNELWKAYPQKNIERLVQKAEEKTLTLADLNGKPIMELFSMGRHGFLNAVFDSKNAPRDVQLRFYTPDKKLVFDIGLSKKGDINIVQSNPQDVTYSEFYSKTGNKKFKTVHYGGCPPETTYYNKDGTRAFWKNFFYGGPAIAPVW